MSVVVEHGCTSTYTATAPILRAFFFAVSKSSSCPTSATNLSDSQCILYTVTNNVPSLFNQPSENTRSIKPIINIHVIKYDTLQNKQDRLLVLQKTFQFN